MIDFDNQLKAVPQIFQTIRQNKYTTLSHIDFYSHAIDDQFR